MSHFVIGQKVEILTHGKPFYRGVITADRGLLGPNRSRIWRVENSWVLEVGEDQMRVASPAPPTEYRICEYSGNVIGPGGFDVAVDREDMDLDPLVARLNHLHAALTACVKFETEPCRFDHDGVCQAHHLGKPCEVAVGRKLLGLPHTPPLASPAD
jgi:hypothetical protein